MGVRPTPQKKNTENNTNQIKNSETYTHKAIKQHTKNTKTNKKHRTTKNTDFLDPHAVDYALKRQGRTLYGFGG